MTRRCVRCDWVSDRDGDLPAEAQAVVHAQDSSHGLCACCGRSLAEDEPATCEGCLSAVRADLARIVVLYAELPGHLGAIRGQSFGQRPGGDEHALPGGTVLALLGPGSDGGAARRLTRTDVERGVDGREHKADNRPEDTASVAWSLFTWAQDWADVRGDDVDRIKAEVPALSGYLEVHARWAANGHAAFAEFAEDMRQLRLLLERATGHRRSPTKAGAACFDCGGDLVRRVNDDGLEEEAVTCASCGEQYDPARYNLALKAAAEAASRIEIDGEQWATPAALASDLRRPENTLHRWRRDDLVRAVVLERVTFFSVADAAREHDARPTRRTA